MLVDTHAHLHFDQYQDQLDEVVGRASDQGVTQIITVGIDDIDSRAAVELASKRGNVFASVGLHPHEAKKGKAALEVITKLAGNERVVAVGECGLDYYRNLSDKSDQENALRFQIELALSRNLPIIFHVRDAFDDFGRIIRDYPKAKGVIHSFSSDRATAGSVLDRGFLIGLNGIMTFTKDQSQLEAAKSIPSDRLLLETDCPFLAPPPHRGKTNEPAFTKLIAEFLAELRGESLEELSQATTANAQRLFNLPEIR